MFYGFSNDTVSNRVDVCMGRMARFGLAVRTKIMDAMNATEYA